MIRPTVAGLLRRAAVARHGAPPRGGVELLVWVGGEGEEVLAAAGATLAELAAWQGDHAFAVLFDRGDWVDALRPRLAALARRLEVVLPRPTGLPQLLYDHAIATSTADCFAFAWPGAAPSAAALAAFRDRIAATGAALVHGDLPPGAPADAAPPVQHGLLRMADLLPMHHCLLARAGWRAAGGFDRSPVLRRAFWWDFGLRLSRGGTIDHAAAAAPPAPRWSWAELPLGGRDPADPDVAARWVARLGSAARDLAADLPPAQAAGLAEALDAWHLERGLRPSPATAPRLRPRPGPRRATRRPPLRLTLVSHLLDAHQCQLYFHSAFHHAAGRGRLSWRTIPYESCTDADLAGCDLLVLSRPRFPQVPGLLDAAARRRLPVLVMIDDNWIAAGREYPRFGALFTPGRPAFEAFLEALRRAAATLVFNPVLEEDLRPHARRVLRLAPSLDAGLYAAASGPSRWSRRAGLSIAYAGSPRWDTSAFTGLAAFLRAAPSAALVLMAHEVPEELRGLPAERVDFRPWRHDYEAYAAALGAAAPDVLLGPLDATRFSASKVPLKLMEAGAVGAAPALSAVAPYTAFVRDGENGLLVENDPAAWEAALHRLAGDAALRRRLAAAARRDVERRFATSRVLPELLAALEDVAAGPA